MKPHGPLAVLAMSLILMGLGTPAPAHGPSGKHAASDNAGAEAMAGQHARMAAFQSAARSLYDAIVLADRDAGQEGASRLLAALKGHERDVPHKHRERQKEFHALFAELGKRMERMRTAVRAGDFPKAAAAYGKVLETCATCHGIFRD